MATQQELLAEAYRRGLLPPEKRAAFEEAQRRGLMAEPATPAKRVPPIKPRGQGSQESLWLGFGILPPEPPPIKPATTQRAAAGAQRDMRSRDEARARRERTSVSQAALSQDRSSALMQGYGFGLSDEIMGLRSGAKTGLLNLLGQDQGYTAREAYDARRKAEADRLAEYARARPVESAANSIGGALLNPLNVVGGAYAGSSVPRAVGVGATMGAAYGAGSSDPGKRIPGAVKSAAIGGIASGVMQGSGNALAARAARRASAPVSPQRQLSAEGVDLTPGQMLGGGWQRAEDSMTSIPVLGDSIREAQRRGIQSFNRAAMDRVLAPVGGAGDDVGRAGLRDTTQQVSQAYQRALSGVTVAPDQEFINAVRAIEQTPNLPPAVRSELLTSIGDVRARFAGPIDGDTWKLLDADLSAAARAAGAGSATQPSNSRLAGALRQLREAVGGPLQRANPNAFDAVQSADEATAILARIREASQYQGTAARDGLFTAGDLNRAVRGMDTSAGNRQFAQGEALMQDLAEPAMQVLPQTVPDSGTAIRSLFTAGGIGGLGSMVGVDPLVVGAAATGVGVGSALYSRPAQAALNAFYRAQTPGQATAALQQLVQMAAREPALAPVVEQLRERLAASRGDRISATRQLEAPRKQQ